MFLWNIFFTEPDFTFTNRHIHNWALFPVSPSHFILMGTISNWPLLIPSSLLNTFHPEGEAGVQLPGSNLFAFSYCSCRSGFNPWVRKIPWRRKWQPTPVLLPGKSHGQSSIVGYSPRVTKSRTQLSDFTFTVHGVFQARILELLFSSQWTMFFSELFTMIHPSWVALHMFHIFTELCKPLQHDKAVIYKGDVCCISRWLFTAKPPGKPQSTMLLLLSRFSRVQFFVTPWTVA